MLEYVTISLLISGLLIACGIRTPVQYETPNVSASVSVKYQVQTRTVKDSSIDAEGVTLARYCYDLPELIAVQEDGTPFDTVTGKAAQIVDTFNDRFEQWYQNSDFAELVQMAVEARIEREKQGIPWQEDQYTEDLTYTSWQTEHLVSIRGEFYSNTGGPYPNTLLLSWNYSLDSGEFISPIALAEDDQAFLSSVTDEVLRQAKVAAHDAGISMNLYYVEDYEDIVSEWLNYAVSFDSDGMRVGFSPDELASRAAGVQEFLISYETLKPLLCEQGRQMLGLD